MILIGYLIFFLLFKLLFIYIFCGSNRYSFMSLLKGAVDFCSLERGKKQQTVNANESIKQNQQKNLHLVDLNKIVAIIYLLKCIRCIFILYSVVFFVYIGKKCKLLKVRAISIETLICIGNRFVGRFVINKVINMNGTCEMVCNRDLNKYAKKYSLSITN